MHSLVRKILTVATLFASIPVAAYDLGYLECPDCVIGAEPVTAATREELVSVGVISESNPTESVWNPVSEFGFALPVDPDVERGFVISGFGMRRLKDKVTQPIGGVDEATPKQKARAQFHRGLDIAGPVGVPVYAARDGEIVRLVKSCENHAGLGRTRGDGQGPTLEQIECGERFGNHIVLAHDDSGYSSVYAHLSPNCFYRQGNKRVSLWSGLKRGTRVARGEQIGCIGVTGASYGAHLHFEVLLGKTYLDPVAMLGRLFPQYPQRLGRGAAPIRSYSPDALMAP